MVQEQLKDCKNWDLLLPGDFRNLNNLFQGDFL